VTLNENYWRESIVEIKIAVATNILAIVYLLIYLRMWSYTTVSMQ